MCMFEVSCLVICSPTHSTFLSNLWHFLICIMHQVGPPHPLTFEVTHCIYDQPWDPTRIHLLCCSHGSHGEERTRSHDLILRYFCFHLLKMQGQQTHVLLPPSIQFFWQWVDIVLSIDGIHTLPDMVINHHQSHLSRFGFFELLHVMEWPQQWHLKQKRTLPWLALNKHISSPCYRHFGVLTLTSRWFFSPMC